MDGEAEASEAKELAQDYTAEKEQTRTGAWTIEFQSLHCAVSTALHRKQVT